MPLLLGSPRKSWWRDIWKTIKAEWEQSGPWGKFTLFFRAIWALLSIGFKQRLLGIAMMAVLIAILAIAVVIGGISLIWIFFSGGYKLVLGLLQPTTATWIVAILAWVYLRCKYPGKYATIRGRNMKASTARQIPFWIAIVLTFLWIGVLEAIDLWKFLTQKFRDLTGYALWKVTLGILVAGIFIWVLSWVIKKLRSGRAVEDKSIDILTALAIGVVVTAILNVLLFLSLPFWEDVWQNQQRFFWATNLALALAIAMFFVKGKDGKTPGWAHKLAYVFLAFVVLSLISSAMNDLALYASKRNNTRTMEIEANRWSKGIPIPNRYRFSFEGTGAFWVKSNYGRVVKCDPVNRDCPGGLEASSIELMPVSEQPVTVTIFFNPM